MEGGREMRLRFTRRGHQGLYRLASGIWRGPGEQIVDLTRLQHRIALLFLESPRLRLSADQIQETFSVSVTDGDPTAYRKHVTSLNRAFGFALVDSELNSGVRSGGSKSRRATYFLSPEIEFPAAPAIQQKPPERALTIPAGEWLQEESPPAALLRAEFCVVPFFGRVTELTRIDDWRNQPSNLAIALMTGIGGRGKTRLAIESCQRAERNQWHAGFTSPQVLDDWLRCPSTPSHIFAVIDYAETNASEIARCMLLFNEATLQFHRKLRILLLARSAGEWWEMVRSTSDEHSRLLHHPTRFLRLPLQELVQDPTESEALFNEARRAFRDRLRNPKMGSWVDRQYSASNEALILFSQALLVELGETAALENEEDVFGYLLSRERRFWLRALNATGLNPIFIDLFERLIAVLTLSGGTQSHRETRQLVTSFAEYEVLDAEIREGLLTAVESVYGRNNGVEPLQPDRLGEHLVAKHLSAELIALASFQNRV